MSFQGLDFDVTGALYLVDGRRVRKIDPDGNIETFAGGDASSKLLAAMACDWHGLASDVQVLAKDTRSISHLIR